MAEELAIKKDRAVLIYKGYVSNSVADIVAAYVKKIGVPPTILLCRVDYPLIGEHPGIIRSDKYGRANIVMASHLLEKDEIERLQLSAPDTIIVRPADFSKPDLAASDLAAQSPRVILRHKEDGRPKHGSGSCPHCKQIIKAFEDLGWWWGWSYGVEPPYWEDLRLFVFQRDKFRCTKCGDRFGMNGLVCHHIVPKEDGGADSSRNLTTMCQDCHPDTKPIYAEAK